MLTRVSHSILTPLAGVGRLRRYNPVKGICCTAPAVRRK